MYTINFLGVFSSIWIKNFFMPPPRFQKTSRRPFDALFASLLARRRLMSVMSVQETAALLPQDAVRSIKQLNERIAWLERDGDDHAKHKVVQGRRTTSWLRSLKNPLRGLLGFALARTNDEAGDATYTPCPKQLIEDERLARIVALALHPQQGGRVKPANGLLCVVVGCGTHGRNIAGELLRRGCMVRLYDALSYLTEHALVSIRDTLEQLVQAHLLLPCDVESLLARCTAVPNLDAAVERDPAQVGPLVVVEATPDFLDVKRLVFDEVVGACAHRGVGPQEVLLCSNTLACTLAQLAERMPPAYAARLIGMRFLHPCWFVDMVDVYLAPFYPLASAAADPTAYGLHMETASATSRVVKVLELTMAGRDRMLGSEEASLCAVRQLMRVEADGVVVRGEQPFRI